MMRFLVESPWKRVETHPEPSTDDVRKELAELRRSIEHLERVLDTVVYPFPNGEVHRRDSDEVSGPQLENGLSEGEQQCPS